MKNHNYIRPTMREDIGILAEIERRAFLPLYEKYRDESCL